MIRRDRFRFKFVFYAALGSCGDIFISDEYGSYELAKTAFDAVANLTLGMHERGLIEYNI